MIKNPEDIVRRAVAAAHEELGDLSLPKPTFPRWDLNRPYQRTVEPMIP
jgi:hypothetical protein